VVVENRNNESRLAMKQSSQSKKHRHSGIVLAGILMNVIGYKNSHEER
jgi:hypothetical protein